MDREEKVGEPRPLHPPLPCSWLQPQVNEAVIPVCTVGTVSGSVQALYSSLDTLNAPLMTLSPYFTSKETGTGNEATVKNLTKFKCVSAFSQLSVPCFPQSKT